MKVLTLNNDSFREHCRNLERLAADFAPDLVVGIATGGDFVAENMLTHVPHISVKCQRATTATKERARMFRTIVKHLPRCINNLLRIAEAKLFAWRGGKCADVTPIVLSDAIIAAITPAQRVLIVDDAVDSGATLMAVLQSVNAVPGEREVRAAVITVTTSKPVVMPHYFIYNNKTLIRFPWSADAN